MPATTGIPQQNMLFSASSDFAVPHPSSAFDFNSDDYESQVLEEWYHRHAAAHANHLSIEGTHIKQTGASVLLTSYSLTNTLLGRIWISMRYLPTKMIGQPKV